MACFNFAAFRLAKSSDGIEKVVRRPDAVLEGRIGIGLAEQREAVAQADVAVVEARPVLERAPLAGDPFRRRHVAAREPAAAPASLPSPAAAPAGAP